MMKKRGPYNKRGRGKGRNETRETDFSIKKKKGKQEVENQRNYEEEIKNATLLHYTISLLSVSTHKQF